MAEVVTYSQSRTCFIWLVVTYSFQKDLTRLITFFVLMLLNTFNKTGMHGLLYALTYSR